MLVDLPAVVDLVGVDGEDLCEVVLVRPVSGVSAPREGVVCQDERGAG